MVLVTARVEPFQFTAVGMVVRGKPTVEEYRECATQLGIIHRASPWLIGDLLNSVELHYGDIVGQAAEWFGLDPGTLMNYKSRAKATPIDSRKWEVSYSHYVAVARLPEVEQTKLLESAEREGWSVSELKAASVTIERSPRQMPIKYQAYGTVSRQHDGSILFRPSYEEGELPSERDEAQVTITSTALRLS